MAIVREEKYFKSSSKDDIQVRYLLWYDDAKKPKAVFQIAHGVQEHIERYDDFARFLVSKGYVVCGNDHLGHGKTAGLENLGVTPDDAAKKMVEDMHKLYKIVHKKYLRLPYIMFGHSMGSYLARSYTVKYGKDLDGAIYCGSCWIPSTLSLLVPVLRLFSKIKGPDYKNHTMTKLIGFVANAGVLFPRTISDWLSFDRKNVKAFIADEYCGGDMGASLSRDCVSVVANGAKHGWQNKIPVDLPVMIISGEDDSCGLFGYGTTLLNTQVSKAGLDTTFKLYKNARHEILNDFPKAEVYEDIADWLATVI